MKFNSEEDHMGHANRFRVRNSMPVSNSMRVNNYLIGQLIGKGGYSKVYRAVEKRTMKEVAIKVIKVEGMENRQKDLIKKEIIIHSQLNHPNIIQIYDVVWTNNHVYIILELAQGRQLFNYLNKFGALSEPAAAKVFSQVLDATQYLHSLNIAHRDIKTENIIIDSDYNVKLIDFGFAKQFDSSYDMMKTFCGSPSYLSPEIIDKRKGYSGKAVDVWCLGVALYVMIEASLPFDDETQKQTEKNISNFKFHEPTKASEDVSELLELIFVDEGERLTAKQLRKSSFLTKYGYSKKISYSMTKSSLLVSSDRNKIINRVCQLLSSTDITESQIKDQIEKREIGEAFCLYNLLQKQLANDLKRKSKSENKEGKYETITSPGSTKNTQRFSTSMGKKIFMKCGVEVLKEDHDRAVENTEKTERRPIKGHTDILDNYVNLDMISNSNTNNEMASMRMNRLKKNGERLGLKVKVAPITSRLRDNVDESPKRILDCFKRYN